MAKSKPVEESGPSLWEQFRNFAFKGNVIDLAIGVIVGAAFSSIVSSLVKDIIMPIISIFSPGEEGYKAWAVTVNGSTINYGLFIGEVLNFILIALILFIVVRKVLGSIMKMRKEETEAVPAMTKDQELLQDILEQLKKQSK